MAPKEGLSLVFLPHGGAEGSQKRTELSSAARAHASRQGYLKSARAKKAKFIIWDPDTGTNRPIISNDDDDDVVDGRSKEDDAPVAERRSLVKRGVRYAQACPVPTGWISTWDPFDSFAAPQVTKDEQKMVHYAFTNTWSASGESEDGKNRFAQTWMWRTMEFPATLYAQALASSTHYLICCPKATDQKRIATMGLRWKGEAIKALRLMMKQYETYAPRLIPENVLVAIFVLAIHGGYDLSEQPDLNPLSPLATYRDMYIYGQMTIGVEHLNVLYHLIEERGGLGTVDQLTFGFVLPLLDLLHSARLGTVPRFPCYRQHESLLQDGVWKPDDHANQLLQRLGDCFRPSKKDSILSVIELDISLASVLEAMAELTAALDHYCRGRPGSPQTLDVFANNCDWIGHTIISMRSYNNSTEGQDASSATALLEILRLCSLIYLDLVIIPSPPHTGIRYRHSALMMPLIAEVHQRNVSADGPISNFLTWAAMMGAIATRFTDAHGRYMALLKERARTTRWEAIEPKLKRYLWFDYVFDHVAEEIWSAI
ncbi:hypothetical protein FDECE_4338 [Fusarium decemcellulare]|nr:hypothetical protein FDECE_4338 [Fusarium decemcellulare]